MAAPNSHLKVSSEDSPKDMEGKKEINEMFVNKDLIGTDLTYTHEIVWKNVIGFFIMNVLAVYGFFLLINGACTTGSVLWSKY